MAKHSMLETAQRLRRTTQIRIAEYPEDAEDGAQPDDLERDALEDTLVNAPQLLLWRLVHGNRLQRINEERTKKPQRVGLRETLEAARSRKKAKGEPRVSYPTPIHTARRKNHRSAIAKRSLRGQDDGGDDS
jgi:hypothetical protein